jgi:hypothetical protein
MMVSVERRIVAWIFWGAVFLVGLMSLGMVLGLLLQAPWLVLPLGAVFVLASRRLPDVNRD